MAARRALVKSREPASPVTFERPGPHRVSERVWAEQLQAGSTIITGRAYEYIPAGVMVQYDVVTQTYRLSRDSAQVAGIALTRAERGECAHISVRPNAPPVSTARPVHDASVVIESAEGLRAVSVWPSDDTKAGARTAQGSQFVWVGDRQVDPNNDMVPAIVASNSGIIRYRVQNTSIPFQRGDEVIVESRRIVQTPYGGYSTGLIDRVDDSEGFLDVTFFHSPSRHVGHRPTCRVRLLNPFPQWEVMMGRRGDPNQPRRRRDLEGDSYNVSQHPEILAIYQMPGQRERRDAYRFLAQCSTTSSEVREEARRRYQSLNALIRRREVFTQQDAIELCQMCRQPDCDGLCNPR